MLSHAENTLDVCTIIRKFLKTIVTSICELVTTIEWHIQGIALLRVINCLTGNLKLITISVFCITT